MRLDEQTYEMVSRLIEEEDLLGGTGKRSAGARCEHGGGGYVREGVAARG